MRLILVVLFIVISPFLFFPCHSGRAQDFTTQISTDSTNANQYPSMHLDEVGRVWIAYASNDSTLAAGYYSQSSWQPLFSSRPPGGLRQNTSVQAAVDELERVWFVYQDAAYTNRLGYYDHGAWISWIPTPPVYGIIRNYPWGIWYYCIGGGGVVAYCTAGPTRTIGTSPANPCPYMPYFGRQCVAAIPPDAIASFYRYQMVGVGMNIYWCDYAMFSWSEQLPTRTVEIGSGRVGPGGSEGMSTDAVASGTDGRFMLGVTSNYYPGSNSYRFNAYLIDSLLRGQWAHFIPHVDVLGWFLDSQPRTSISASTNSDRIAVAWFSRDTLRIKIFAFPYWYTTKTYFESVSDSGRRDPKVVVDQDSTVWVCFTANKNNRRHVFLSRIRSPYIIDNQLSDVQERSISGDPIVVSLYQNYPNPFNPRTSIGYRIQEEGFVSLKVYDLLGREVATLVNEEMRPGRYEQTFDASGLGSGVYFYRLSAKGFVQTRKLILQR